MKKRILTLFLVFLVILMPVSISLSTLYVSLNEDGQVRVSQNSCSFSGMVDCSEYTEDKINEIKTKSVKDIKDDDVDYLIGALQCDNLVAITAKSIGDIADGADDLTLTKDHPITRTIEPLIVLTKFDKNNLEKYSDRIDDIIYALSFVVTKSDSDISAYINDDFVDNLLLAPSFNKESSKYVIAFLRIIAKQSGDFTPYFLKNSHDIFTILSLVTVDENSVYYLVYGIDGILNGYGSINIRDFEVGSYEFYTIKKMIEILSKSLDYETSRGDALTSINYFVGTLIHANTKEGMMLLSNYFLVDTFDVDNRFYLLDHFLPVLKQGNPAEKRDTVGFIFDIFINTDGTYTDEYKAYLLSNNKINDFKNSLKDISDSLKNSEDGEDQRLYIVSLILISNFFDTKELGQFDLSGEMIDNLMSFIGPRAPNAKRNLLLLNKDFNKIYDKLRYINEDYKRYSLALSVWRYVLETKKNVDDSITYITNIRASFIDREILGPNKNLIVFTHDEKSSGTFTRPDGSTSFSYRFDNSNIIRFAKEAGVLDDNIKKDDVEEGNTYFKGPGDKEDILKAIANSKGETVIWFDGHGSKNAFWLSEGEAYSLSNGFFESKDSKTRIDFTEIGDALKVRGNLDGVIIIIDACFSYDFAKNLYNHLGDVNKPTIITETNKGSYGYSGAYYTYESPDKITTSLEESWFLSSLIKTYIDSGRTGPLKGEYIFNAEQYSMNSQDSAVFFGGKEPVEIASNNVGESECSMCEEGVCPV